MTKQDQHRLGQEGNRSHLGPAAGKDVPARNALPTESRSFIDMHHDQCSEDSRQAEDPVLALRGLGKEIWASENADDYVRRQRAGWLG